MFITVSRTLKRGSKERRDARQKMIFKREREREEEEEDDKCSQTSKCEPRLSRMRYKKRERETKRIRVPLSCSDSNLWTRGWRIATLLLPRCRARPFARCRHHPPKRWSRALFSSSFSPKKRMDFVLRTMPTLSARAHLLYSSPQRE